MQKKNFEKSHSLLHSDFRVCNNIGFVGKMYGEKFVTNSYHHQGVLTPAKDLKAVAWSENGKVIEALEHEFLPIISVQWHPERMCCDHLRADTVNGIDIFEYFIKLCKQS